MSDFEIFVCEDDQWYADFLMYQIGLNPDFFVKKFYSGKELLAALHLQPDVITLDYSLPDFKGEDLVKLIKKESPNTEIIIISGQSDISVALNLLKNGVYDYLVKDNDIKERLWNTLIRIKEQTKLKDKIEKLSQEVSKKYDFSKSIIGSSDSLKHTFQLLEKACQSNINVSITGETGTGKELIAKAIHYNSKQKKGPFVAINVSAIPKELIESELFGHEKGAFTGAQTRRIGKFEEAEGGTIFLDEIGEMDLHTQVKILRVLQEKEIVRVGENKAVKINCRIITATHRDLNEEVQKNRFRQDLYYRLIGLPIELAPLRERKSDIIHLSTHFIKLFAKENDFPVKKLSEESIKKLLKYNFPGNVRELKSIIDLAMVLSDEQTIEEHNIVLNEANSVQDVFAEELSLNEVTNNLIKMYMQKYKGNIPKVAEILDIGKSTIYRLIKENNIEIN
ncbi:MAG: sigma-54-dependent transcriptional regulator [Flavobacteriia bacterium]|jgi:two-component system response regulator AtoC